MPMKFSLAEQYADGYEWSLLNRFVLSSPNEPTPCQYMYQIVSYHPCCYYISQVGELNQMLLETLSCGA